MKLVDFRRETREERQRDMDAILKIDRHALKSKGAVPNYSLLAQ